MDRSTKATTGTTPTKTTSAVHVLTEPSTEIGAKFLDICSKGMHDCSTNGTCISLEGSFDCECNLGYEGDGRICAGMFLFSFIIKHNIINLLPLMCLQAYESVYLVNIPLQAAGT